MNKIERSKYTLAFVVLIYAFPLYFSQDCWNVERVDIYLFSDYARYPENITYDIAELLAINMLIFEVYSLQKFKREKRYALAFLITSLLGFPAYFLIYSQGSTLVSLPILIGLLYDAYRRNKRDEKRVNTR